MVLSVSRAIFSTPSATLSTVIAYRATTVAAAIPIPIRTLVEAFMFFFGLTTPASGPYLAMRPMVRPTLRHGPRLQVAESFDRAKATTGEIRQH